MAKIEFILDTILEQNYSDEVQDIFKLAIERIRNDHGDCCVSSVKIPTTNPTCGDQDLEKHLVVVTNNPDIPSHFDYVINQLNSNKVKLNVIASFSQDDSYIGRLVDDKHGKLFYADHKKMETLALIMEQLVVMVNEKVITIYNSMLSTDESEHEFYIEQCENVLVTFSTNSKDKPGEPKITINNNKTQEVTRYNAGLRRYEYKPSTWSGLCKVKIELGGNTETPVNFNVQRKVTKNNLGIKSKLFRPDFFKRTNPTIKVWLSNSINLVTKATITAKVIGPDNYQRNLNLVNKDNYFYYHFDLLRSHGVYNTMIHCQSTSEQDPKFSKMILAESFYQSEAMQYLNWCSLTKNRSDVFHDELGDEFSDKRSNDDENKDQISVGHSEEENPIEDYSHDNKVMDDSDDREIEDILSKEGIKVYFKDDIHLFYTSDKPDNIREQKTMIKSVEDESEDPEKVAKLKDTLLKKIKRNIYFINNLGDEDFAGFDKRKITKEVDVIRESLENNQDDIGSLRSFDKTLTDIKIKLHSNL